MKLPAYPSYKPSGVEWLGDVPGHWEVKRLKWVGESIIGLTYSPADVVSEGEGTLVLRSSNIQGGRIVLDDNVFVSAEIPHKLRTRANDIVICTRNGSRVLVGKTGKISEREAGLTFGAFTAVFRSPSNAYMFYVFNSGLFSFQAGLYQTSTIFQLTNGTLNAFQIPLPPSAEQRDIAAFLDRETGLVDRLVSKKRELIERLKEKRIGLISRTVTRGLPPAAAHSAGVPENPPLKPSGLDWLGDIPKHWESLTVRRRAKRIQTGGTPPTAEERFYEDGTVPWFGPGSFDNQIVVSQPVKMLNASAIEEDAARMFVAGATMVVTIGATLGKVSSLTEAGSCNQQITVIEFDERRVHARFATYQLKRLEPALRAIAPSATLPILDQGEIADIPIGLPPFPEQAAIAAYLDAETGKLDALVHKVEEAIERL